MTQKLKFKRHFTADGVHPFDQVKWKKVDAVIIGSDGKVKFELKGAEVPEFWSERATKIVAEKYFRVCNGKKETSGKEMFTRVASTIAAQGDLQGLFEKEKDRIIFEEELLHILVNQMFAFNSPVWFNIGVPGVKQQASACFIQTAGDTMEELCQLQTDEVMLFKGGSGTGSNLSSLRSSYEDLSNGGVASGPVSFMEGYNAWAGVTKSGGGTRRAAKMVMLNHNHPDILELANGRPGFITCKQFAEQMAHDLIDTGKYSGEFHIPGNAYELVGFQNANNSVRVTDEFMRGATGEDPKFETFETKKVTTGDTVHKYNSAEVLKKIGHAAWFCGDPGIQYDTTINKWHTCKVSGRINGSNPCSEYMFLDDSACNLGSFNLMKFLKDGEFMTGDFIWACFVCITAMEILVGYSSYPNEKIARNSRLFRPLGIGYANLGALLMSMGLPYDSDEGREVAGALTSLMSGACYAQSALMARAVGAFEEFRKNRDSMLDVIEMHRQATADHWSRGTNRFDYLHESAANQWDFALELGREHGYRNSQISVLAPTGTISFLMDCDTTGGEPMTFLVAKKKLIGGHEMVMPNLAVVKALKNLSYSSQTIMEIEERIATTGQFPLDMVRADHQKVFQTAVGSDAISVMGHLLMMAAQQPFLSGAISKTVNMPAEATVEDVIGAYIAGWKLGLKAVAIYRDGCKRSQPLSDATKKVEVTVEKIVEQLMKPSGDVHPKAPTGRNLGEGAYEEGNPVNTILWGERKRLPLKRKSITHKFSVGGQEGYLHVGMYEDGTPAEVFINVSKAGSTLHGVLDMWATAMSIGLQHGVPLYTFIEKFRGMQFMPSGFTDTKEIRTATSLGDYIARWLEIEFYSETAQYVVETTHSEPVKIAEPNLDELRARVAESAAKLPKPKTKGVSYDGPPCNACGGITTRSGKCYTCTACGDTTGCG
jgi:ribonucleoside-diphosphate reductase alpha chain